MENNYVENYGGMKMNNYGLKIGMKFKNYKEFSDFVGYEETNSREVMKNRVIHHCNFHKVGHSIIIDDIKEVDSLYIGRTRKFIYNVNDIVNVSTGYVQILECFHQKAKNGENVMFYKCKCLNDGYIYNISQYSLRKGVGCEVCLNKVVLKGINDIATTRPEIAELFKNKEETFLYTQYSGKTVEFICPYCGNEKKMRINTVSRRGHIQCNQCCDHFSYPNKFVYSAMKQICPDIKCEVVFDWSNNKRYDLYSKAYRLIIENQGGFHYETNDGVFNIRYEYTKKNDEYKKNIALNNDIENYIELNCQKSDAEYIKKSILESDLPKILKFCENDIDWNKCEKYATNSLVYEVYHTYKNGITNKTELSKLFNIGYATCDRYLKKAFAIPWLND